MNHLLNKSSNLDIRFQNQKFWLVGFWANDLKNLSLYDFVYLLCYNKKRRLLVVVCRKWLHLNNQAIWFYYNCFQRSRSDWLIDFNDMSIHLGLFYALMYGNRVHCASISTFFWVIVFSEYSKHSYLISIILLSHSNNLNSVVGFQVFPSNANNYMLSSDHFYLIVIYAQRFGNCVRTYIFVELLLKSFFGTRS